MTKNVWSLLTFCVAILGATACGGSSPPANDAGITIPDGGGGGTDSGGGGTDSGGGGTDSGGGATDSGGGGTCELTVALGDFGAMSAACLPRCSAATASAVMGCGTDATCVQTALMNDTTAGTPIEISGMSGTTLTCALCFQFGQLHCFSDPCPDEVDGLVAACFMGSDMAACTAASNAVNTCLMALSAAEMGPVGTCLNSDQGAAGCF